MPDAVKEAEDLEGAGRYAEARDLLEPELRKGDNWPARAVFVRATYKDPDLPMARRYSEGLRRLTETVCGDANRIPHQESAGIAAAIYKDRWELDGQESNLRRALSLYRRAAEMGIESDQGWTALNVAFVLDVLADLEERQEPGSPYARARRAEASRRREEIVAALRPTVGPTADWWLLATLIEALIGLGREREATPLVQQAAALIDHEDPSRRPAPWQVESTARQLAAVARLGRDDETVEAFRESPAGECLRELLGPDWAAGVESAWTGKIGLALSGGGFRAALFHIGVLARLAELDVLRRVEVLSCVSGGSIVGAYYYLKVCARLGKKTDAALDPTDYLELVQEIEKEFLTAIGSNIRMRLLTNPFRIMQMALCRGYTRTERAGQLYQKRIYKRLGKKHWRLPDLLVVPKGENEKTFKPKQDNWHRRNKVPILVINATTMNTGHNWQFTGTWMGEPPSAIDDDVDSADRLRRMYHKTKDEHDPQAPEGHRETPLGRAVAASAAVPGLFPPITLRKLYRKVTVRLSDGGVHDNQGVASLVDQECTVMLVSDASGQGEGIKANAGDRALPTLARTTSVAMSRIREAQYLDLAARRATSSLRGLMFVHLKQDLPRIDHTWEGGVDRTGQTREEDRDSGLTPYGIREDVQRRLASIRTDLDAFHEYEAYGLMASGYRMTEHYFPKRTAGFDTKVERHDWRFASVQSAVEGGDHCEDMLDKLRKSHELFFKWFPVPAALKWGLGLLAVALVAAAVLLWACADQPWPAIVLAAIAVAGGICAIPDGRWFVYVPSLPAKFLIGVVGMVLGPLVAWTYLLTLNRWYLADGRAVSTPRAWGEETA